jgi:uroporphyrinogen decarboxylase
MNSRERMTRSIEFKGPDRLPRMNSAWPLSRQMHGKSVDELFAQYPDDCGDWFNRKVWNADNPFYQPGRYTDEWGSIWENTEGLHQGAAVYHPLEDWSNWASYKLPSLNGEAEAEYIRNEIARLGHDHYVLSRVPVAIFQRMVSIRGYENVLMDLATGAKEGFLLRDALLEYQMEGLKPILKSEADGVHWADDWGSQTSLMINPELWRKMFRPVYAKVFDAIRSAGKHVFLHSDGYTLSIIPDLIEVGANVINVEHPLMGEAAVGVVGRGKVCFRTYIDGQHILPYGTPTEVRANVRAVVEHLSTADGGIIAYGELAPDVPLVNLRAMLDAFLEYWPPHEGGNSRGRYPGDSTWTHASSS